MRKIFVVIIAIVLISSSIPAFAEEGGEKTHSMMGESMMMHKMEMMPMMEKMQRMMTEMMGMMNQCQEMMEESGVMMSGYTKKDTMGEEDSEESSGMPSGHESHH